MCENFIDFVSALGPTIVAIVALIFVDRHIKKQVNLNAKVQWIDTFRLNAVKLLTCHYKYVQASAGNKDFNIIVCYTDFLEQMLYLSMLLNRADKIHNKAYQTLQEISQMVKRYEAPNSAVMSNKIADVYNLCESIIETEQKKLL